MNVEQLEKRQPDPGLQPQRTVLSWFRTAAVVFLNALLLIKVGSHTNSYLFTVLGTVVLLLATFIYFYSIQRNQKVIYDCDIVSNQSIAALRIVSGSIFFVSLLLSAYFFIQLFNQISEFL